jgi:hypothetical protein
MLITFVIPSAARDLQFAARCRSLGARDDNLLKVDVPQGLRPLAASGAAPERYVKDL